jgi:hypothetical protein
VKVTLLALDREQVMIGALAALMVAGLVISVGAALLLRRDRREERRPEHEPNETTGT